MILETEASGGMVSVVIPAHNEEAAIGSDLDVIIRTMAATGRTHEIVVVDDGSTDATGRIARDKGVKVIRHPYRRGTGAALKTGINAARGEVIVMTDADNTYPNADIPRLLEGMERYDMVIGARRTEQGTLKFLRRPVKAFIAALAGYITGSRIPDLNSGFRAFSRDLARRHFNILPSGHSWVSTITLAFLSYGHTVGYIPIDYFPRTGSSHFHPVRDTGSTLLLVVATVMYFRPLRIFLPLGSFLFAMGFARTIYDARVLHRVKESDIMIVMTALIVLCIGFLADLIVKMHRDG